MYHHSPHIKNAHYYLSVPLGLFASKVWRAIFEDLRKGYPIIYYPLTGAAIGGTVGGIIGYSQGEGEDKKERWKTVLRQMLLGSSIGGGIGLLTGFGHYLFSKSGSQQTSQFKTPQSLRDELASSVETQITTLAKLGFGLGTLLGAAGGLVYSLQSPSERRRHVLSSVLHTLVGGILGGSTGFFLSILNAPIFYALYMPRFVDQFIKERPELQTPFLRRSVTQAANDVAYRLLQGNLLQAFGFNTGLLLGAKLALHTPSKRKEWFKNLIYGIGGFAFPSLLVTNILDTQFDLNKRLLNLAGLGPSENDRSSRTTS